MTRLSSKRRELRGTSPVRLAQTERCLYGQRTLRSVAAARFSVQAGAMCNHYRNDIQKAGLQYAIYGFEEFSETRIDPTLRTDVYPDREALVFRLDGERGPVVEPMRWGFPPPPKGDKPVTNVRNTASGFWRPWLKPENRCLVPVQSFAEFSFAEPKGERWFLRPDDKPFFFAGIWREWEGVRGTKANPVEGVHRVFSFLTCEPNGVVKPWHAKAMPVILRAESVEETDAWLNAPMEVVLELQRPLADAELVLAA